MNAHNGQSMKAKTRQIGHVSAKLIACLLILVCLAVGAIGILLPIIPGILFLVLAAVLLTRHFPITERWMRRNSTMRGYLDSAEGFSGLDGVEKIKLGALLCARILIQGLEACVSLAGRLLDRAASACASYRATGRSR